MIKPWHLGPFVVAAALGASAYWWHTQKDAWTPPAPRKPDLPKVEAMPKPPRTTVRQAQERPLLWTSRRAVKADDKKGKQAKELTESRLMAVLESGKERVALLQRANGTPLKITTETKPWHIESFDGRKAVFVSADGQRIERPLEAGKAPAPTPAPARKPPAAP